MGIYDLAFRQLATQRPGDFALLALGKRGVRITELSPALKAQARDADFVGRVDSPDGPFILHIEFERKPNEPMDKRVLEYGVALHLRESLPVLSYVFRMQKRGRRIRNYRKMGSALTFRYWEIGLLDLDAHEMLCSRGHPVLLALVPLCEGGNQREVLEEAVRRIHRGKFERTLRADLFAAMMAFGRTNPDTQELLRSLVRREDMKESNIFKDYIEQDLAEAKAEGKVEGKAEGKVEGKAEGKAEGKVEGKAEDVLHILERRFGAVPKTLRKKVLATTSLEDLQALIDLALDASSIKDFAGRKR